ncbi:MAG: hypothetical protein IJW27_07740 [Clostridia bacterium]|nr:hypothetical protein [Clostridia bacterium]
MSLIRDNREAVAVMRGPVVYCAKGVDNEYDVHSMLLDPCGRFSLGEADFLVPSLYTTAYLPKDSDELYFEASGETSEKPLKLIPYFAFANRGESDMIVWIPKK